MEVEASREIYWNVGHGIWTLAPMYLITLAALAFLLLAGRQRLQLYRQGLPLARTDTPGSRMVAMLADVLMQRKVVRVLMPGLLHALFFWGFLLLLLGTTLIVVQADFTDPLLGVRFLKGTFYKIFSLVLDLAGLVSMVMLAGLFIRRYLIRPEGLETKGDDLVMHALLMAILLTGFVVEGCRMAVTEMATPLALWSPVGNVTAQVFVGLGEEQLRLLHKFGWWSHFFLVMAFLVLIPKTKFRHLLTTATNSFFADRGPKGKLITLDLEREDTESFGAKKITELTWKDIFDTDACTLCKRCQDRCPAHATGKPLSPMRLISTLGQAAAIGRTADLIEMIGREALWACTTCRACQEICPAGVEHLPKIIEMRRSLVLMAGEFPGDEVMAAMEQTEVNGNPLGMGYAFRGDWVAELGVKSLAEDAEVDILYFVGCYASFDKRNIAVAKSFVQLCRAAGVKVGILGKEEKCCGEPMRKMGNEYLYQTLAAENIATLAGYGVKKIVTTCPHCFNTLAKDYRDLGLEVMVEHATTFLHRLLVGGRLRFVAEASSCTYHDSCYLGRHNDIYDAPRALLRAAGCTVNEMEKCGAEAFCCSAGGGRILAEEKLGDRINIRRVAMASATGAEVLVASCPFCLTMFEDGVKGAGVENSLKSRDLIELLAERLYLPEEKLTGNLM